jgi:hypothetical protein
MCESIFDFDIKIRKVLEILNNIAGGVNNKPREVMNVCLWVSEDVEMAEVIYETIMCLEG